MVDGERGVKRVSMEDKERKRIQGHFFFNIAEAHLSIKKEEKNAGGLRAENFLVSMVAK